MIIISQVSLLGRELEMRVTDPILASSLNPRNRMLQTQYDWNWRGFDGTGLDDEDDEKSFVEQKDINLIPGLTTNTDAARSPGTGMQNVEDTIYVDTRDPFTDSSQRVKMMELLEAWEEPDLEPGKPVREHFVWLSHGKKSSNDYLSLTFFIRCTSHCPPRKKFPSVPFFNSVSLWLSWICRTHSQSHSDLPTLESIVSNLPKEFTVGLCTITLPILAESLFLMLLQLSRSLNLGQSQAKSTAPK